MQAIPDIIRIGTRASALALAQAEEIRARLLAAHEGEIDPARIVLAPMTTTGDASKAPSLADIGGKALFTKEIEEALLANTVDIAVHSLKDMQAVLPSGLAIAAVPEREDPRDAFVSRRHASFSALPEGATVGTSSPRRAALLKYRRPDLNVVPLRGNVPTRLAKLERNALDATLLAVAGLKRLGRGQAVTEPLEIGLFPPAAGQGALCVECREADEPLREWLEAINHLPSDIATTAERAMLAKLGGSCRTPIAAYATIEDGLVSLIGMLLSLDGAQAHSVHVEGSIRHAAALGTQAGQILLDKAGPDFTL
jgi:hydroxymethylbilane synthase